MQEHHECLLLEHVSRLHSSFIIGNADSRSLVGQAMSMVNYHTNPPKPGDRINPDRPVFVNYAQLHVWAWGLSRRISKLGVAIAICGCVCVVARVLLGYLVPRKRYSPVELVVAALQYQLDGDFKGTGMRDMARVRYAIQEEYDGKPRFEPEQSCKTSAR